MGVQVAVELSATNFPCLDVVNVALRIITALCLNPLAGHFNFQFLLLFLNVKGDELGSKRRWWLKGNGKGLRGGCRCLGCVPIEGFILTRGSSRMFWYCGWSGGCGGASGSSGSSGGSGSESTGSLCDRRRGKSRSICDKW